MTFTVTYRAKDGALADEVVEAASRAECVAECKRRGIVPMSIREGRASARPRSGSAASPNGRAGARPSRGAKRWRAAILAVSVLVVGVGVWWWQLARQQPAPYQADTQGHSAGKQKRMPHSVSRPEKSTREEERQESPPKKVAAPPAISTNSPPMPVKRTTNRDPNNTNIVERIPGRGIIHHIKPQGKPLPLKYSSERDIARLILFKPGQLFLPVRLGKRFTDDFKASLNEEILILETDSDEDKEIKRAVIEGKRILKEAMDRGEDVVKIMENEQKELEHLAQYRDQLERDLRQIKRTGTPEEVEEFVNAANKLMKEYGIAHPLRMPIKEKMFLRRERRAAALHGTQTEQQGEVK